MPHDKVQAPLGFWGALLSLLRPPFRGAVPAAMVRPTKHIYGRRTDTDGWWHGSLSVRALTLR